MSGKFKYSYFVVLILFIGKVAYAQQTPVFSQYMMNSFFFNPAIAGAEGYTNVSLVAHEQWAGFGEIAPKTHALAFQTRFMKNSWVSSNHSVKKKHAGPKRSGKVGMGGILYNDQSGYNNTTGGMYTYAYHMYFDAVQFSMGMSGKFFQAGFDFEEFKATDPGDPIIDESAKPQYVFDSDLGVFLSHPDFYVGLSATDVVHSRLSIKNGAQELRQGNIMHYHLLAGYLYYFYDTYIFEPSVLVKGNARFITQMDVNLKAFHKQGYWVGLTYRTRQAVILLGGIKIDKLLIGYACDVEISDISKHSYGTHEFTIVYNIGDNTHRYRYWDRY